MSEAYPATTNPSSWSLLALFASAAVGAEVATAIELRRSGQDPSEQEEPLLARASLRQHAGDFRETLVRLGIDVVSREQATSTKSTGVLGRFSTLLLIGTAAKQLHRIHQRLLSLYPHVDGRILEQTRLLESSMRFASFKTPGRLKNNLAALVDSGWELLECIERLKLDQDTA